MQVLVTKPPSLFQRGVRLDGRTLFKAAGRVVIDPLGWLKSGLDVLGSVKLDPDDLGQLAWRLVAGGLLRAVGRLVVEEPGVRGQRDDDAIRAEIERQLAGLVLTIGPNFVRRARELPILEALREPLEYWLVGAGLEHEAARAAAGRLPELFVVGLNEERGSNVALYEPLLKALEDAFELETEAALAEAARVARAHNLPFRPLPPKSSAAATPPSPSSPPTAPR